MICFGDEKLPDTRTTEKIWQTKLVIFRPTLHQSVRLAWPEDPAKNSRPIRPWRLTVRRSKRKEGIAIYEPQLGKMAFEDEKRGFDYCSVLADTGETWRGWLGKDVSHAQEVHPMRKEFDSVRNERYMYTVEFFSSSLLYPDRFHGRVRATKTDNFDRCMCVYVRHTVRCLAGLLLAHRRAGRGEKRGRNRCLATFTSHYGFAPLDSAGLILCLIHCARSQS